MPQTLSTILEHIDEYAEQSGKSVDDIIVELFEFRMTKDEMQLAEQAMDEFEELTSDSIVNLNKFVN